MGCSFSFSSFRHVGVMGSFLVWERSRKGAEWQENYGATEGEKEGQDSPQPHLENDSSPRQPSPHLILGCPVVMFFNYVSLFNVAAAHPYLVNRCNFSCRVEMQPSHPGIKGQIELPRAHTHTHTHTHRGRERERERERERFTFISIFFQATSAIWATTGRFSACQATFKENVRYGNLSTVHEIFYFCLHCNPWKYF